MPAVPLDGDYAGETYYHLPGLKPGHYKWLIAGYLWIGGMMGGAAVLAVVADYFGTTADRHVVRIGRWLALAGGVLGPALLIADLHTPQRFYNMLRIFRRQSAMSIGVYILTVYGTFSGLTAAAQLAEDLGAGQWTVTLGKIVGLPAALGGAGMTFYTATLLAATSPPLWAAVPKHLAALFAASSMSIAAAAVIVVGKLTGMQEGPLVRLERIDLLAIGCELILLVATDWRWRRMRVADPLYSPWWMAASYLGLAVAVGMLVPFGIHGYSFATGIRAPYLSLLAAISALIGGLALRSVVLFAGRRSAEVPQLYFQFAQLENIHHARH